LLTSSEVGSGSNKRQNVFTLSGNPRSAKSTNLCS
jgi:hypothetical protein